MEKQTEQENKHFWKSLGEKYNTPEFIEKAEQEFQSSPLKQEEVGKSGLARRQFMKLMGASVALSTAACVRRPVQKIIPYNKRPAEVIPGIANYYASSFFDGREGFGVTIKTREGRPIHIEPNTDYPGQGRGLSVRASAQILNLYDPDRIRTPIINSQDPKKRGNKLSIPRDWDSLDQKVAEQLKKGGVRVLTSGSASPSLNNLLKDFATNLGAKVSTWTPLNYGVMRDARQMCYGKESVPKYRYDKAKMIVSIDGDFLGSFLNSAESTRLFAEARKVEKGMARLVSFQSVPSLTSLNADDNYPIKASQQLPVVLGLIHELIVEQGHSAPFAEGELRRVAEPYAKIYLALGMSHDEFASIAKKLWENRGQSVVVAGGPQTQTKDAHALQVAVTFLNNFLGNEGKTILAKKSLNGYDGKDADINSLIQEMSEGKVKTLIIDNLNPMYNLPQAKAFKEAMGKVEMIVSTSNWMDETANLVDVIAPAGHALENWGDFEFEEGLQSIQQPTIQPLHNTRSFADSLMTWSKLAGSPISGEEDFYSLVKKKWESQLGAKGWYDFLQKGFIGEASASDESVGNFNTYAVKAMKPSLEGSKLELSLYAKTTMHDGTMTNVSWLQELPDPVTKVCWDNYLIISPKLADDNDLRDGDLVNVKTAQFSIDLPVFVQPGQHPESVAVAIGYGRKDGGELQKDVGFDVTDFIQWDEEYFVYSGLPVEIKKVGKLYPLAQTQEHHNMMGRDLAVETTEKHFNESGDIGIHRHKIFSIWNGHKYDGHKWGMSIDLNSCTGCSACVVACQSENNIPVVGKKYVMAGREMHWLRIDRYYAGDEKKRVDAIFQPVTCQQCENAPCETVCPVLATVHSDEGLNDMAYNRCVGTRYCANNCPYKVRRFNWFYYDGHHRKEPIHMALNPDVTVRTRGVMEKCTFCVQRIKEAKNTAKDENRPLKDGDIKTACESVCPGGGIVFGDLNDPESRVSKLHKDKRVYTLLEEYNAAPRNRYLAKLRNTDRELGGGHHGSAAGHGDKAHGEEHGDGAHKEGH